jgi:hypothetical protein
VVHQLQRAGDHRAAAFPNGRSVLVDFIGACVADEDHFDLLVIAREEEVQQDEEALGRSLRCSSIEPDTSITQNITARLEVG